MFVFVGLLLLAKSLDVKLSFNGSLAVGFVGLFVGAGCAFASAFDDANKGFVSPRGVSLESFIVEVFDPFATEFVALTIPALNGHRCLFAKNNPTAASQDGKSCSRYHQDLISPPPFPKHLLRVFRFEPSPLSFNIFARLHMSSTHLGRFGRPGV